MASLRRHHHLRGIPGRQRALDDYHHRYPVRHPDLETVDIGLMAFRQPGYGRRELGRLPVRADERDLDIRRRVLDLPDPFRIRIVAVHYDYRHPQQ